MFTVALFTLPKMWKQSKGPSTDERIKKMWHIYTGILLRHKKDEILPFSATWMDPEIIILSEVTQRKTNIMLYHLSRESEKKTQMNLFTK